MPVKLNKDGIFNAELAQVIKDGFSFIGSFYLELDSKKESVPALLNLLMLNYDNYLDIDDNKKISPLTKQKTKEKT